jgi:hypothetical protein
VIRHARASERSPAAAPTSCGASAPTLYLAVAGSTGGAVTIAEPIPGGAVRIAVDGSGAAWVVNDGGTIFRRD